MKKSISRHIITKVLKISDKINILKALRDKGHTMFTGIKIKRQQTSHQKPCRTEDNGGTSLNKLNQRKQNISTYIFIPRGGKKDLLIMKKTSAFS